MTNKPNDVRVSLVGPVGKYDEVLKPFTQMMEKELHANSGKGDRPGWLSMPADTCMLEIYYHLGKLQKAVKDGNGDGICEFAADVANLSMMLTDICGALALFAAGQPADQQGEPVACKHEFIYFGNSTLPRRCRLCGGEEVDVVYQWRPVTKELGEPMLSGSWSNCTEGEFYSRLNQPEAETFNYSVRKLYAQAATAKVDERAEFEAAVQGVWGFPSTKLCMLSGPDPCKVWQARANLNGVDS